MKDFINIKAKYQMYSKLIGVTIDSLLGSYNREVRCVCIHGGQIGPVLKGKEIQFPI